MSWSSRAAVRTLMVIGLLAPSATIAARRDPAVVYDSDYAGYVPIVDEIQRPDLVTRRDQGRVPETLAAAIKRTRRALSSRRARAGWAFAPPPREPRGGRGGSRRWQHRQAVTIDLTVLDAHDRPIPDAEVFVASDPSFYAVNDDGLGARLFGSYRYLPYSYASETALADLLAHARYWRELRFAPVRQVTPNIDQRRNPWLRDGVPSATPPLEFIGQTNTVGALQLVSGVFNLLDVRRFPRAIAPGAFQLVVLVLADGFTPTVATWRYTAGGTRDNRTITLLDAPARELFARDAWQRARWQADRIAIDPAAVAPDPTALAQLDEQLADCLALLDTDTLRLAEQQREGARHAAAAALWDRVAAHAPAAWQVALLQRALDLEVDPMRHYRLGRSLLAAGRDDEARRQFRAALELAPRFRPAYVALDQALTAAHDAPARQRLAAAAYRLWPFDRWARARLASFALRANRPGEAFDHLRYTWSAAPGLGGDRELAESLFDYYWRLGLTEKAGSYLWLYSGQPPEDPLGPPR